VNVVIALHRNSPAFYGFVGASAAPELTVRTLAGLLGRPSVAPRSRVGRAPTSRTGVAAGTLLRREGYRGLSGAVMEPRHYRVLPPSGGLGRLPWLRMVSATGAVLAVGSLVVVSAAGDTTPAMRGAGSVVAEHAAHGANRATIVLEEHAIRSVGGSSGKAEYRPWARAAVPFAHRPAAHESPRTAGDAGPHDSHGHAS
jgi:hypothetical protein